MEERRRMYSRICGSCHHQPVTGSVGKWIFTERGRDGCNLHNHLWNQFGVDEICIKKGECNGNHSVPVDGGRRCSDWLWILLDGNISGFTVKSTLLLFYMAMLSAVAFSLWTTLLKYNPVGKVTIYGFSIPIFGAGLSAVFLGEDIFSLKNLVALLCVSAGIILVNKMSAGERIVANEKEMK